MLPLYSLGERVVEEFLWDLDIDEVESDKLAIRPFSCCFDYPGSAPATKIQHPRRWLLDVHERTRPSQMLCEPIIECFHLHDLPVIRHRIRRLLAIITVVPMAILDAELCLALTNVSLAVR